MPIDYMLVGRHMKNFFTWTAKTVGIVWELCYEILVYYNQTISESVGNLHS